MDRREKAQRHNYASPPKTWRPRNSLCHERPIPFSSASSVQPASSQCPASVQPASNQRLRGRCASSMALVQEKSIFEMEGVPSGSGPVLKVEVSDGLTSESAGHAAAASHVPETRLSAEAPI